MIIMDFRTIPQATVPVTRNPQQVRIFSSFQTSQINCRQMLIAHLLFLLF